MEDERAGEALGAQVTGTPEGASHSCPRPSSPRGWGVPSEPNESLHVCVLTNGARVTSGPPGPRPGFPHCPGAQLVNTGFERGARPDWQPGHGDTTVLRQRRFENRYTGEGALFSEGRRGPAGPQSPFEAGPGRGGGHCWVRGLSGWGDGIIWNEIVVLMHHIVSVPRDTLHLLYVSPQ